MADVFDKETKKLLKSVNTPDYFTDRYIINPSFVPSCESKYIVIEANNTIREMTAEEKAVVDYVEPIPEPTPEELALIAENERKQKIKDEIEKIYSITDEIGIIREALATLLPDDSNIQEWNDVINNAKLKYPK